MEERRRFYGRKTYIQYDFRASTGELFSCVAGNLTVARAKRDMGISIDKNGTIKIIKKRSEAYEAYINPRSVYISWDFSTESTGINKSR
jgi:hypothetical protein